MNIAEKNIVITGAGGNVGRELTQAIVAAGATVITVRRGPSTSVMETRKGLFTVKCDLTNEHAVKQLVQSIQAVCGDIHSWINVAGGFASAGEVEITGRDVWTRMMSVNFITTLNCCQAILPHMKKNRRGEIINFGSYPAEIGMANAAPYAVAKAAIHALTKSIAREGEPFGIRAWVIAPETIDTPANRQAMPDADWSAWVSVQDISRVILDLITASDPTTEVLIPVKKETSAGLPEPDTSLLNIFSSGAAENKPNISPTPSPAEGIPTEEPKPEPEVEEPDTALEDLLNKAAQVKTEIAEEVPQVAPEEPAPSPEPEAPETPTPETSDQEESEKEPEPSTAPEKAVAFQGADEEPLFNPEDLKHDTTPGNELDLDDDLFADSRVFAVDPKDKTESGKKKPEEQSEPTAEPSQEDRAEKDETDEKPDYQYNQGFKEATNRLLEIFKKPTAETEPRKKDLKEGEIDPDNASFEMVEHLVMRYEYDKALKMLDALERRGAPADKIKEARQEIEQSRLQDDTPRESAASENGSTETPSEEGDLSQYISDVTARRAKEKTASGKKKS